MTASSPARPREGTEAGGAGEKGYWLKPDEPQGLRPSNALRRVEVQRECRHATCSVPKSTFRAVGGDSFAPKGILLSTFEGSNPPTPARHTRNFGPTAVSGEKARISGAFARGSASQRLWE